MTEQELKEKIVGAIIPIIEPSDELIIIETMGEKPSARKVAERIADALIAAELTFKVNSDVAKDIPKGYYCNNCKYLETHTFHLIDRDGKVLEEDYIAQTICTLYNHYVTSIGVYESNNVFHTFKKCEMCLKKQAEKELAEEGNK